MNSGYKYRSRFASKKLKEARFALANGGEVGGISNEGNTCFMNSVIQSLASSRLLVTFIDSYLYSELELDTKEDGQVMKMKTTTPKPELVFTNALKTLLEQVNGSYGTKGKEFSTKQLLNKMPNGPKQNFFSGYNQEDAQEFYQLVMGLLEKEFKGLQGKPSKKSDSPADQFVDVADVKNLVLAGDQLGKLGTVYVPAFQVDPNMDDKHKFYPLELITPVDGISADRIGCLTCGEVGGIRYSVTSGLSLNLPNNSSYYTSFNLNGLMDNWITPEIIEDVNCNRCGLNQTRDFLIEKLATLEETNPNGKILDQFKSRLDSINQELKHPHITDDVFEKLTIKQMIKKSKKSKQIFLSRPPPLLSIHINRSVFDPRTYLIVKNPSNVQFPATLDLSKYTAEPEDINMDARLSFRKQDERSVLKSDPEVPQDLVSASPSEASSGSDFEMEDREKETVTTTTSAEEVAANPSLLYGLKAVISHYGTHNYGHYICFRKFRGTWWRISDESVYVVNEDEVLSGQGTFMLFYEYDDGHKEVLNDVSDSEEEEAEEEDDEEIQQALEVEEEEDENVELLSVQRSEDSNSSFQVNLQPLTQSISNEHVDDEFHYGEERVHL
ncbi:cysteine proteinase [Suhomyces tanzawaensis NRRL Y-17324]|uniref:Ubiquitin carboxyl-terminal hydrolase n=1 Tax=Suhomyces tanzawaensis NRRL Y-17324 TaxID=984487 RepID=A0A1E4SIC9_9ASCO|nr:cysteine proteinase [Suhomyces tanzawaensis NRRL Y-17324]ODV79230.1 cysteine proteinase [Suhomyces tanzawaensis NRRL Y-17324]